MPYVPSDQTSDASKLAEKDESLAASLFRGRSEEIAALFLSERARPPHFAWSPNRFQRANQMFEDFLGHCWSMPSHAGLPRADALKAADMPHSEWLVVAAAEGFGRDFRYLYYGSSVTDHFGADMRGRYASDHGGHVGRFLVALYRAAMQRRQVALSEHEPHPSVFVQLSRRLIVPMVDHSGFVNSFAVLHLPENPLRSTIEALPVPCLLLHADRRIRFANASALSLIGNGRECLKSTDLEALLGTRVTLPEDPASLVSPSPAPKILHERLSLPALGGAPARLGVGGVWFRANCYFVLTIFPGPGSA